MVRAETAGALPPSLAVAPATGVVVDARKRLDEARAETGAEVEGPTVAIASIVVLPPEVFLLRPPKSVATVAVSGDWRPIDEALLEITVDSDVIDGADVVGLEISTNVASSVEVSAFTSVESLTENVSAVVVAADVVVGIGIVVLLRPPMKSDAISGPIWMGGLSSTELAVVVVTLLRPAPDLRAPNSTPPSTATLLDVLVSRTVLDGVVVVFVVGLRPPMRRLPPERPSVVEDTTASVEVVILVVEAVVEAVVAVTLPFTTSTGVTESSAGFNKAATVVAATVFGASVAVVGTLVVCALALTDLPESSDSVVVVVVGSVTVLKRLLLTGRRRLNGNELSLLAAEVALPFTMASALTTTPLLVRLLVPRMLPMVRMMSPLEPVPDRGLTRLRLPT